MKHILLFLSLLIIEYNVTQVAEAQNVNSTSAVFDKKQNTDEKPDSVSALHDKAILLARRSNTADAVIILEKLHTLYPKDLSITRDYIAVSSWAGRYEAATKAYESVDAMQPAYVLQAVAYSYRAMNQIDKARSVYQLGLNQSPDNPIFISGIIRCYADQKNTQKALSIAAQDLKLHGDRLDVLLSAVYAAKLADNAMLALDYSERAVLVAKNSREARVELITSIDRIGAPQEALQMAQNYPDILALEEYARIQADEAAAAVRWGALEPANERERYIQTDRAIAMLDNLINDWSGHPEMSNLILRARFDRLVALRDRSRMKEIIAEYNDMRAHNIQVPIYALSAVGDAYLYLREPEKARDIYLVVIKNNPEDFNSQIQLFYAYAELDDFDAAYKQIETLDEQQRIWIYLKGLPEPVPNPERATADLTAGFARLYGEELSKADTCISTVENAAPNNPLYRAALGALYETRELPRQAQEQYQIGFNLAQGQDISNKTGEARTNLQLQNFQTAGVQMSALVKEFPENLEVQSLDRDWQIYNMYELRVDADHAFRSSTDAAGGEGTAVEALLFSRPIDYNWRIFAGELFANETEPSSEGTINYSRSTVGVEYRGQGLTASIGPTYNAYNSSERAGGRLDLSYAINDNWTVAGNAELFSRDTPLRALNAGVTANAAAVNATYRQNESREVTVGSEFLTFSDGNDRSIINGEYTQRIFTRPDFKIDAIADIAASNNTADENRLYYNPGDDLMTLAGANFIQTLYHRYDTLYEHNIKIMAGDYLEQSYGSSAVETVEYDQSLSLNKVFKISLGINFSHQDYDGIPENAVSILGNLNYRF